MTKFTQKNEYFLLKNLESCPKTSYIFRRTNEPTNERKKNGHPKAALSNSYPAAKVDIFLKRRTNERIFNTTDYEMKEKITRERLRNLPVGESITVQCEDGYDLDSQRNTAYAMRKLENKLFSCVAEWLQLTVTRYEAN